MTWRFLPLILSIGFVTRAALADSPALPRSTPEAEGLSSAAVLSFVEGAEAKVDALHSFMLLRHGRVVAEGWWAPYAAEERHQMFSLSKSFTSVAVGLAIADGKLSLDDTVVSFFPEKAPAEPSANLRAMRVRDLLTMSTGHHDEAIAQFFQARSDLVAKFLALPVEHKPGTFFVYNTPATFMLSALKGSGVKDFLDWAAERIPLGPWHFPEDQLTDLTLAITAAEVTREKLFLRIHEEIPYNATVETEKFTIQKDGSYRIDQVIYVTRDTHKKIVLGAGGQTIKAIGADARKELMEMYEVPVHLFLFVKVREKWADDPERYREMGLEWTK